MIPEIIAILCSFLICYFIIFTQKIHKNLSMDPPHQGLQKFHIRSIPRIGGIGIFFGVLISNFADYRHDPFYESPNIFLIFCLIPIFGIGLLEDLTKSVSIRLRLTFTVLGAIFATQLLGIGISKMDVYGLDLLLSFAPISIIITIFAITGLTNAFNIIDGLNGLSSMTGIITLAGLGYMGWSLNDPMIISMSLPLCAAILGFFILNYPKGLIFLGDGGAYLIGFSISVITILLINRHPEISPWFAVTINVYAILEPLFSIYRRKFIHKRSSGLSDRMHMHSLIFKRIAKGDLENSYKNSRAAHAILISTLIAVIYSVIWYQSTFSLIIFTLGYAFIYYYIYKKIVTFNPPKWIHHLTNLNVK